MVLEAANNALEETAAVPGIEQSQHATGNCSYAASGWWKTKHY